VNIVSVFDWKLLLIDDLTATTIYEESVCVFIIVPSSQLALTVVAPSERQRAYGTNKVSRDRGGITRTIQKRTSIGLTKVRNVVRDGTGS
jgi:hypothetical protein